MTTSSATIIDNSVSSIPSAVILDAPILAPVKPEKVSLLTDADINFVRISLDARDIEHAEMITRLFVNDFKALHPDGDIIKHIMSQAMDCNCWLAARRGTTAQKVALFASFAGPNGKPRGLTNTLRDAAILASQAPSAALAEKYSEVLRVARFANSCSKMISMDKKNNLHSADDVFQSEETKAAERAAARQEARTMEEQAMIDAANLAAMKDKVEEFLSFVNEVTEKDCKLTKAQIVEQLLTIATK
jgi:hypothetical protein